jgi:hypothetical protein
VPADGDRLGERGVEPGGERLHGRDVAAVHDHDELVAAPPAREVLVPDGADESATHGGEDLVTHVVAEPVVHALKPSRSKKTTAARVALAVGPLDHDGQPLGDRQPVRQAGRGRRGGLVHRGCRARRGGW